MDYYDEPDYYEPTEADKIFQTAYEQLKLALNEQFAKEYKNLQYQIERLEAQKKTHLTELQQWHERVYDLEKRERELERKTKRMPIGEFLGQREVIMYQADYEFKMVKPKCDDCNTKRQLVYVTPRGKTSYEMCECAEKGKVYSPKEHTMSAMRKNNDYSLYVWFKSYDSRNDEWSSSRLVKEENVYSQQPYDKLDPYNTFFRTVEECQKYCDWLNEKEQQK